jgi:AraC-like DNA-binding protein
MFEPTGTVRFREDSTRAFVAGESWVYFGVDADLLGYAVWGAPAVEDIEALVNLLVDELDRAPHAALVDLEHLETVAADPFDALARYTMEHEDRLARGVRHTAIVKPRSRVNAALVAGFFDVTSRPFPFSLWESKEAALAQLGRHDARVIASALDELRARVTDEPSFVRRVRVSLAASVAQASLEATARELGVSVRTLQRRLAEHTTTFEAQVQEVRLDAAMRRLRETDTAVTTMALDLGFSTAQHFATLFRKHTGETPSQYRARHRLARG